VTILQDKGISVIDSMVNVNPGGDGLTLSYIPREAFRDEESVRTWPSPGVVKYLFKGAEDRLHFSGDPGHVVGLLDKYSVERANVIVKAEEAAEKIPQLEAAGDRWFYSIRVNPHEGMRAVRKLEEVARSFPHVASCCVSPHALYPTIPPNAKEYYPIYAKCIELDLPIFLNVGIPGPRVPGWTQDPMHLDEVCWFFPDLKIVMKHGGEPWVELCIKLMLKWPNLYYSTSGFSPKYYPKEIIHYANTRGSDKILYAGYWPLLDYDDIMTQISQLPLRDHVWQKMFSDNARKLFKLP
jgi:uncharacterized protein